MPHPSDALAERRKLAARVRVLWSARSVVIIAASSVLVWYLVMTYLPDNYFVSKDTASLAVAGLAAVALAVHFIYVELKYRNYFYKLGRDELIIQKGVLDIERVVIPYAKIQSVSVTRTMTQRILGSGSVHIQLASTNTVGGEAVIPAVKNFQELVEELREKAKISKQHGVKSGV